MAFTVITFVAFTALVAVLSWWKTRGDDLSTKEGYFLDAVVFRVSLLQVP